MGFGGYLRQELKGKAEADERATELGQEAVVVAASASEAVTVGIEGDSGDDGELDGVEVGEVGALGFDDAEGALLGLALWVVDAEPEVVAIDDGQEDGLPVGMTEDEVVGIDFIGQGVIEQDGVGLAEEGMLLKLGNGVAAE